MHKGVLGCNTTICKHNYISGGKWIYSGLYLLIEKNSSQGVYILFLVGEKRLLILYSSLHF